jgi:hypothetical protein
MDGYPEFHATDDAAAFQLRPLTTGEVFDRTFAVYRRHFWLFTAIALGPALVSLLSSICRLTLLHFLHLSAQTNDFFNPKLAIFAIISGILTLAIYGTSQAASTIAVSSVYLGRPATAKSSYQKSLEHWLRYPLLIIVQFLSAGWVTVVGYAVMMVVLVGGTKLGMTSGLMIALVSVFLVLSFPYTVYRYIKVSLAIPASVVEDLPIRASLKRSKALLVDRKGRIFLVFLLLGVLYMILGAVLAIVMAAAVSGQIRMIVGQTIAILTTFVISALLQPIGAISFGLLYFDERVRREGFDIEFMLQSATARPVSEDTLAPIDGSIEV